MLVVLAAARRRLEQRYEVWRWIHVLLAITTLTGSALHVLWLNHLVNEPARCSDLRPAGRSPWPACSRTAGCGGRCSTRRPSSSSPRCGGSRRRVTTVSLAAAQRLLRRQLGLRPRPVRLAAADAGRSPPRSTRSRSPRRRTCRAGSSSRSATRATSPAASTGSRPGQPVWVDGPHGSFTSDVSSVRGRRHDRRRRRHHPDDEHGARGGRPPRPPTAPARRRRPQPRGPAVPRRARLAAGRARPRGHRGAAPPAPRLGGHTPERSTSGCSTAVLGGDQQNPRSSTTSSAAHPG